MADRSSRFLRAAAWRHGCGAGQHVRVVNTHGTQVVDTWAFSAADPTEWMAMEASRAWFLKLAAAVGDSFVTNRRRPILTLVEDTSGCAHDTLMAPCDQQRYGLLGVKGHHDNCRDNLHAALAELGITIPATPPSLNVFMNIPWTADGAPLVGRARVGARQLRALPRGDGPGGGVLRVPQDILPINGRTGRTTEAHFTVE